MAAKKQKNGRRGVSQGKCEAVGRIVLVGTYKAEFVGIKTREELDQLAAQVISAFKQAVPTEKAQKAISTIMHQGGFGAFITMGMKVPYSPTGSNESVILNQLPGGEKFVARDMMSGHFMLPLLDDSSMKATLKLDVAPDGNTATLTLIANTGLTTGNSKGDNFGNVELTQQITFDLRPEVPVVTNVQLGQTLL